MEEAWKAVLLMQSNRFKSPGNTARGFNGQIDFHLESMVYKFISCFKKARLIHINDKNTITISPPKFAVELFFPKEEYATQCTYHRYQVCV